MVLTTGMSHKTNLLAVEGINVSPSGRLPSVLESPIDSSITGISARFKVRQTKSLKL